MQLDSTTPTPVILERRSSRSSSPTGDQIVPSTSGEQLFEPTPQSEAEAASTLMGFLRRSPPGYHEARPEPSVPYFEPLEEQLRRLAHRRERTRRHLRESALLNEILGLRQAQRTLSASNVCLRRENMLMSQRIKTMSDMIELYALTTSSCFRCNMAILNSAFRGINPPAGDLPPPLPPLVPLNGMAMPPPPAPTRSHGPHH